jgi:tRNA G18 (ribose-2'-O)-methylase SpoU
VQRGHAVRQVERRVGERQMLAVGLHACEVAVERTAAETDLLVDEDVRLDVLAFALEPEPRSPRLRRTDLEHAQAA